MNKAAFTAIAAGIMIIWGWMAWLVIDRPPDPREDFLGGLERVGRAIEFSDGDGIDELHKLKFNVARTCLSSQVVCRQTVGHNRTADWDSDNCRAAFVLAGNRPGWLAGFRRTISFDHGPHPHLVIERAYRVRRALGLPICTHTR